MKDGNTAGRLVMNQYVNPSGTFYYLEGLFAYLKKQQAEHNEQEICLVHIITEHGPLIMAVVVDYFLLITPRTNIIDTFYNFMAQNNRLKQLGNPSRYLSCYFAHNQDGSIALTRSPLEDKTLADTGNAKVK